MNTRTDLKQLLIDGTPLLDLRSEGEFEQGTFAQSTNVPLLNNTERAKVGTCYKKQGEEAAKKLGHQLISGTVREQRIAAWSQWLDEHPDGVLYCWRGGLRSRLTQMAIAETGRNIDRVEGGYKALRRVMLDTFNEVQQQSKLTIIAGATGSGKTEAIHAIKHSIDLEGRANHRGSAFGQLPTPQPSQISFENSVGLDLLKTSSWSTIWLEDESHLIGRNALPLPLRDEMKVSPRVIIREPFEHRVDRLLNDYVDVLIPKYIAVYGDSGYAEYKSHVLKQLNGIKKRLGGVRHDAIMATANNAFDQFENESTSQFHREWIGQLLSEYYDPMYEWQLGKKETPVLFEGDLKAVIEWANSAANS